LAKVLLSMIMARPPTSQKKNKISPTYRVNSSHPEKKRIPCLLGSTIVATIPEAEPNSPTFSFWARVNEAERKEDGGRREKTRN
jgi:hypothetical protein